MKHIPIRKNRKTSPKKAKPKIKPKYKFIVYTRRTIVSPTGKYNNKGRMTYKINKPVLHRIEMIKQ